MFEYGGSYMEKDHSCEFIKLCEVCHPESEMAKKRENCSDETCRKCGVYWAFKDGYLGLDED